jgi:hypothetical protein
VITAVPGKVLKVYAIKLVVSAAISVNFRDGASTDLEGSMPLVLSGGYVEAVTPPQYILVTSQGKSLDLVIIGAGTASGRVSYWDSDEA